MVKNYELKRFCLENQLQKVAAYISKNYFISEKYNKQALNVKDFNLDKSRELIARAQVHYDNAKTLCDLSCNEYGDLTMKIASQLNHNQYERKIYLKNRIGQFFMTKKCYFLTLTFNNHTLENTTHETRRRYVTRFLKSQSTDYVANIDFGKKNEREHYHAITTEIANFKDWEKYGFISVKSCRNTENDLERVAKYINKLTNHALKETTRQNRIIYSKGFKS